MLSSEDEYVAASAVAQENAYPCALLSGYDRSPLGPTCVWKTNLQPKSVFHQR